MSVPALHSPSPGGVVLYSLPDYEPAHESGGPRRWSSLRPVRGRQLALVGPAREPSAPAADVLWRLVLHLLEVLDGRRPVGQMRGILSDSAYEAMLTRLRTGRTGRRHRLRRLHSCHPASGVVELSAVLEVVDGARRARRVRGAAVRLELVEDQWRCSVLRVL